MRALVTRPAEDAARLAAALAARGIEVLIEPLLTIRPTADGASHVAAALPGAQALLFTSANGVRAFAAATARRDLPTFAVGEATAAAAREAGFARIDSAAGTVDDLARLVRARLAPETGALVHAAATAVAGDLAGQLGAAGFAMRRVVLYEAVAATALGAAAERALRQGTLDLALFLSPRTARIFAGLAVAAGLGDMCREIIAVVLSAAVSEALAPLAWRAVRVARLPSQAALLAEIDTATVEREASA